ncbi:hypothetical protein E1N66_12285 [Pantoea allii]|uniref:hypothetical protein n=1 Tax=Enterobacter agglomerans TaxID=549 RepID=UPI00109DB48F|nr:MULTISPECIES: hypothetical protein [Pantoea]THB84081.1 hypothetical protein E1N66_12285 [Pantoea allii]
MNVTQVGEIHNCDCGFSWRTGKSGSHECGYGLRKQMTDLKAQRDALAAENVLMLKLLTDISENHVEYFSEGEGYTFAGVPLDYVSEINTYVSRDVNAENPFPATDAYLNSVRAEGVEMVKAHPAISLCSLTHVCEEIAAQLLAGKDGD